MEQEIRGGNDSRRLLVMALSVLSQLTNRCDPFPTDIQILKQNAQEKEALLSIHDLASSIIRRETRMA
jgi:hypothetical protein